MYRFQENSKARILTFHLKSLVDSTQPKNLRPIVFLGAGCSISAGLPDKNKLIKKISLETGQRFNSLDELASKLTEETVRLAVEKELSQPTDITAHELFALLIKQGFFNIILTTNWDFLIEASLFRLLPPSEFRTYIRGEINDDKLAELLIRPDPKVKVVKLHGDTHFRPLLKNEDLQSFNQSLRNVLKRFFDERGLIIAGSSLNDIWMWDIIKNLKNLWYVDPKSWNDVTKDIEKLLEIGYKSNKPKTLEDLGLKGQNHIDEKDGFFPNFIQGLCFDLLGKPYRDWWKDSGSSGPDIIKKAKVENLTQRILKEISPDTKNSENVLRLIYDLLKTINNQYSRYTKRNGRGVCLIFINDPSAPGGEEIRKKIMSDIHALSLIEKFQLETIMVTERIAKHQGERDVKKWTRTGKRIKDYGAVVIIDSVSFTGHTLNVVRNFLIDKEKRAKNEFIAALLLIPRETKESLENDGWQVIYVDEYERHQVTFPWGWTRATRPVYPKALKTPFLPASSFGYTPKPWGDVIAFCHNALRSVRLLIFERGQRTSLHYHFLRTEILIVLDHKLQMLIWDKYIELGKHDSIEIPPGVPHCLIALDQPCSVLEIASGHYEEGKDIVRISDIYGREKSPEGIDNGYL